jgi:uncharacterized protein YjbI with pentapeptide repeats
MLCEARWQSLKAGFAVADEEHIRQLKQGVDAWNTWRRNSLAPLIFPALTGANLSRANLRGLHLNHANLTGANLTGANLTDANLRGAILSNAYLTSAGLRGANLIGANLSGANLSGSGLSVTNLTSAGLSGANLTGANLTNANLTGANLIDANLSGANLSGANLSGTNLSGADLRVVSLRGANLSRANLSGADLTYANLTGANLTDANLSITNLTSAGLTGANLTGANLSGANLSDAVLLETIFVDVDLTSVIGLEKCTHRGPSTVDHRTLQKSGSLPVSFLRNVGLPERLIDYLPSLLNQAIQHYSCFISYSTIDQDFANRLHADLQYKGVRCWFAPHDLRIGDKILDEIDNAIRLRDKVLLILSEHSIGSDWVEDEVKKAFEEERTRVPKQTVLFPIRLDDAVMDTKEAWAGLLRRDRNIGDFRRWEDHGAYKQSFERVMRDLTIPPKIP